MGCTQSKHKKFQHLKHKFSKSKKRKSSDKEDISDSIQEINEQHILRIKQNYKHIVDDLDDTSVKSICDYLIQDGVSKVILEKFINPENTRSDHVRHLLDYLCYYGTETRYFFFLAVLKRDNYWIFDKITSGTDDRDGVEKICPTEPKGDTRVETHIGFETKHGRVSIDLQKQLEDKFIQRAEQLLDTLHNTPGTDVTPNQPLLFDIVISVQKGSIIFVLSFKTVDQLDALWKINTSNNLGHALADAFVTEEFKKENGLLSVTFQAKMAEEEYIKCRKKLLNRMATDTSSVDSKLSLDITEDNPHDPAMRNTTSIEELRRQESTIPYFFLTNDEKQTINSNSTINMRGNSLTAQSNTDSEDS